VLTDVAVTGDRNVVRREAEILSYKDLIIEIHRMWNVRANVISHVNNSGDWKRFRIAQTISEQQSGRHELKEQQQTAMLGTVQ
jgi:hypothetical protein